MILALRDSVSTRYHNFQVRPLFYTAYEATWPSEPGRVERRDLYLLWYLLRDYCHGATQKGAAIDAVVHWFAGPRR